MVRLPTGNIILAGNNANDMVIARFNSDGSVDTSFGAGGKTVTDFRGSYDKGYAIAVQPNGSIIVGGQSRDSSANYDFALARYTSTGVLDATFGTGGKVVTDMGNTDDAVWAVGVLANGQILAAGRGGTASTDDIMGRHKGVTSLFDAVALI